MLFEEMSVFGAQPSAGYMEFLVGNDSIQYTAVTKLESFNYWYLISCCDFNRNFWCSYQISKRKGFIKNVYIGLEGCKKFDAFKETHPEEFI